MGPGGATRDRADWAERSLRLIGFLNVLDQLSSLADTARGQELCLALRPAPSAVDAEEGQALVREAERFLVRHPQPPLGGGYDVRPVLERAERGGGLAGAELWQVGRLARAVRLLGQVLESEMARPESADWPVRLAGLASGLLGVGPLERELTRCLAESGEVLDSASPLLEQVRARIRRLAGDVRERLDQFVRGANSRYLQEPIVTQRGGRFVVPVQREFRRSVPGLVHDTSASGQTLFVEPMAVLELNNQMREAEGVEREETERILAALSQQVAAEASALRVDLEVMAMLDLAFARARLGTDMKGVYPELAAGPILVLRRARHPALGSRAVPIDLELGRTFRTLVVSGPNTGGKTVSLKTAGLMAAMAASGMRVPAADGTLCGSFDHILADIGDEQSIEQSLSTFSSHMTAVVAFLELATKDSLVLLDELGAGTDPTEGGALGMAVLEALHQRGCATMVTTHLSELKRFAALNDRVESGSVEFDLETLAPTYRFHLGVPGQSNALLIAERLGLPRDVVERAEGHIEPEVLRAEDMLRHAADLRRRLTEEEAEARRLRHEAEEDRRAAADRLARVDGEAARVRAQGAEKAREIVRQARMATEAAARALREAEARRRSAESAIGEARAELSRAVPDAEEGAGEPDGPPLERAVVGQRVHLSRLGMDGRVVEPPGPDGKALVQVGAVRLRLPLDALTAPDDPAAPDAPPSAYVSVPSPGPGLGAEARQTVPTEIHLRGMRAQDALREVDAYLDRAMLAGLERVRIVHGKGTGVLRRAVAEMLDVHPAVSGYRLGATGEGGDGVTVAELGGNRAAGQRRTRG